MGRKNLSWILVTTPYHDEISSDDLIVRTFDESIDPIELMWHRDDETRVVQPVSDTDWLIQLDDELPKALTGEVLIDRHRWHRLIKGTSTLTVKIKKL
jgi:hypothetical protein